MQPLEQEEAERPGGGAASAAERGKVLGTWRLRMFTRFVKLYCVAMLVRLLEVLLSPILEFTNFELMDVCVTFMTLVSTTYFFAEVCCIRETETGELPSWNTYPGYVCLVTTIFFTNTIPMFVDLLASYLVAADSGVSLRALSLLRLARLFGLVFSCMLVRVCQQRWKKQAILEAFRTDSISTLRASVGDGLEGAVRDVGFSYLALPEN